MLVKKHIYTFYLEFGNFLHQNFFDPPIFKYIHNTNQPELSSRNHHCLLLQPGPLKLGVQRLVATAPAFEQHTPPFGNFFFSLRTSYFLVASFPNQTLFVYPYSKQAIMGQGPSGMPGGDNINKKKDDKKRKTKVRTTSGIKVW